MHDALVAATLSKMTVDLPECVTLCMKNELPNSTCRHTNASCVCTSQKLDTALEVCVAANCTVIESLPLVVANTGTQCYWNLTEKETAVGLGFGQDIWMLSPDQITRILFVFFLEEFMYAFVICSTKVSIILFYLRIFPEPWFRKACLTILIMTAIFGVWHILQILFVSWPISYNWTFWDGRHSGRRGNVKMFSFINAGINIALDLALFILPVTQFITMSWTLRTKIGTSLIFLVGL
ncbi:CFEM domain-containing protein, partial [Colletotrichum tofieldiae]